MPKGHAASPVPKCLGFAGLVLVCAARGGPAKYPVEGKVVFKDGKPLPGGMVVFAPVDPAGPTGARAYIQPDGTFRLSTDRANDGILQGRYRVLVVPPPRPPGEDKPREAQALIDPRFMNFETSGLEYEVKAGDNPYYTITVDRPPPGKK